MFEVKGVDEANANEVETTAISTDHEGIRSLIFSGHASGDLQEVNEKKCFTRGKGQKAT
jgi:hypothetical protein